jgi:hypothetical protein
MKAMALVFAIFVGFVLIGCTENEEPCEPNMLCATLTGTADGEVLSFSLYEITENTEWPPTAIGFPSWAVEEKISEYDMPYKVRIADVNTKVRILGADGELQGRIALAVASMPANGMVPKIDDEIGFSETIIEYEPGKPLEFGTVNLLSEQDSEDNISMGGLAWEIHELGEKFPNAIYMDVYDINGDGILDVVANNNLFMAMGEVDLEEAAEDAMVLAYLMDDDQQIGETIHLTTELPTATGIKVIEDEEEPVIILGTGARSNTLDTTDAYAFIQDNGDDWQREAILTEGANYNMSLVIQCDLDQDGDADLVIAGKDQYSADGSWLENEDGSDNWIPHLREHPGWGGDVVMHSSAAFACDDVDGDDYPDIVYQPLYTDFTKPEEEQKSGIIIVALNPGNLATSPDTGVWEEIMIDTDHYLSADMWVVDINEDGRTDILSNNLYKEHKVSWYEQPANIDDVWPEHLIADGINVPGDMYYEDVNDDGLEDVCVAEVMGNRSLWFENPGVGEAQKDLWEKRKFFSGIGLPGDFVITDFDDDGDMDYVGVSMVLGKVLFVEQVEP